MSADLLHRRLSLLLALTGLAALMVGGGAPLGSAVATVAVLLAGLRWRVGRRTGQILERLALPVAGLLLVRAFVHVVALGEDAVFPVVDLLLLLLAVEAVRPLEADNEVRLHALAFALLLAATAYRPGLPFALCFLAFLGLGVPTLALGHLREVDESSRGDLAATSPGELGRLGPRPLGALLAITFLFTVGVFFAFPRLSSSWMSPLDGAQVPMAGFGDPVTLGSLGTRILPNPQVVFRVQFPGGARPGGPLYWRGRSYDHFDGLRWSRSPALPPSMAPGEWAEARWPGPNVNQTIRWAGEMDTPILFSLAPVLSARVEGPVPPFLDGAGDLVLFGRRPAEIQVTSRPNPPSGQDLREAEAGFIPASEHFLQLPNLPAEITRLAGEIVEGIEGRYDRVRTVERWFHAEFNYTLELPASPREATVPHFLLERREGHCEYFASGMVVLLRSLGIQSRLVNGFLGGQWNETGGFLAVSGNQAHAWVEVWFPGFGWIPFDPTPPGTGPLGDVPTMGAFRLFVDGLHFRWNRWVLEYGQEDQVAFLDGVTRLLSGESREASGGDEESRPIPPGSVLALILAVGLAVAGFRWVRARETGGTLHPASQPYRKLRRLYLRHGVAGPKVLPPLAFLDALDERGLPGREASGRLVQRYLAHRFLGVPMTPEDRSLYREELRAVKRGLASTDEGPT